MPQRVGTPFTSYPDHQVQCVPSFNMVVSPYLSMPEVMERRQKLTEWLLSQQNKLIQKVNMFMWFLLVCFIPSTLVRQWNTIRSECWIIHRNSMPMYPTFTWHSSYVERSGPSPIPANRSVRNMLIAQQVEYGVAQWNPCQFQLCTVGRLGALKGIERLSTFESSLFS